MYTIKESDIKKLTTLTPDKNIFRSVSKYRSNNPLKRIVFSHYLEDLVKWAYWESKSDGSSSVIDIGCGEGILLYLVNKFKLCKNLAGVDKSIDSLKIAKQVVDADFIRADAHHLPLKNSTFELSFCLSVFEHIDRHENVVKEIIRVSKRSVITIPRPMLFRFINIISLRNLTRFGREKNHLKEFKKSELLRILPGKSSVKRRSFWYVATIN